MQRMASFMKKTIKVKKDKEGNAYLDLKDFKDIVNIAKVKKYTLEEVNDDEDICLILKFYDKNNKVINVKVKV